MNIIPPIPVTKEYDHEDDREDQQEGDLQASEHNSHQLQHFEDDYNFAKLTADVSQLYMQTKSHDQNLRHLQKEVDCRVTESHLSEVIALINSGIQTDPNLVKLLKTKEGVLEQQTSKSKQNALSFARKLNQMNECLSVLLGTIRKLQSKINLVESDLTSQLNQKINQQQILVEESRSQQVKENMELQQKMELISFEMGDKLRDIETKTSWRLSEFKAKIDEKISEQFVKEYCENMQKRVDQNMKEYQLSSNIHPDRIEAIERQLQQNHSESLRTITQCEYQIATIKTEIETKVVKLTNYQEQRLNIQKRLDLFNCNFSEVYGRVKTCEAQEKVMNNHISKLLNDSDHAVRELQRINTVLTNLKIGEDFQRMLQEMNPTKVLELQDRVDGVHNEQRSIFRQIELAKREIEKINAKSDIMGVMLPNQMREKFKKEQLQEALTNLLNDHQFTHKIASIDRQLAQHKLSVESISLLTRQVARIQKEDESHRVGMQLRNLEQRIKKELLLIHSHLKEREHPDYDRPPSKRGINTPHEIAPIGDSAHGRSFSLKKLGKINSVYSSSGLGVRSLLSKQRRQ